MIAWIKKHVKLALVGGLITVELTCGLINVSAAVFDLTIVDVDLLGLFDGICIQKYNEKYEEALTLINQEDYSEAYNKLKVCKNARKYFEVNYSNDEVDALMETCKSQYTKKKIQAYKDYLKYGELDSLYNDGLSFEAEIIEEDARGELQRLENLVDLGKNFQSSLENGEYYAALEFYSNEGLDGYLLSDLQELVLAIEDDIVDEINSLLDNDDIERANEILTIFSKYSTNMGKINEVQGLIDAYINIDVIKELYENEEYLEIIKIINGKEYLLNDQEIERIYQNSERDYANIVLDQIEQDVSNNDFDTANAKIVEALNFVKSENLRDDLYQKLDEYSLCSNEECWCYGLVEDRRLIKEEEIYINNRLYNKVFRLSSNGSFAFKNSNEFSSISGGVFVDLEEIDDIEEYIVFNIYGDNELLDSFRLDGNNYENSFKCDCKQYETIRFEISDSQGVGNVNIYNITGEI